MSRLLLVVIPLSITNSSSRRLLTRSNIEDDEHQDYEYLSRLSNESFDSTHLDDGSVNVIVE